MTVRISTLYAWGSFILGTHIKFRDKGTSKSGKTRVWGVSTLGENPATLGDVVWFARWRKYVFAPWERTVYEETCLREIAEFCEARTKEHRAAKKVVAQTEPAVPTAPPTPCAYCGAGPCPHPDLYNPALGPETSCRHLRPEHCR